MQVVQSIQNFKKGNPVILTIGTFDGVHLGHKKIIERLRKIKEAQGGEIVVLTFDPHPRKVLFPEQKDLKLLNSVSEKIDLLEALGVDTVIVQPFTLEFANLSSEDYIKSILVDQIGVQTLVIGYDHRFGKNREGGLEKLKAVENDFGFKVEEIPAHDINEVNISSTQIRKALELGDLSKANEFLGYSYFFNGTIVEGKKLGRTIGFPTANIKNEEADKLIPATGVYAVKVSTVYGKHLGMMNIGYNPTTDTDNKRKVEVNIFDFDKDLYNTLVKVELVYKLRDEKKFANLDELKAQLASDKLNALKLLS